MSIWEEQLQLDWSSLPNWTDIRPDAGPHLSRLPEELLSAVTQFMQQAKEDTERVSIFGPVAYIIYEVLIIIKQFLPENIKLWNIIRNRTHHQSPYYSGSEPR